MLFLLIFTLYPVANALNARDPGALITQFVEVQRPTPTSDLNQPERRQFVGDCVLACGVLLSLSNCPKSATACECSIFNNAGPVKIDICAACLALFFPAAGADIIAAGEYCEGKPVTPTALAHCSSQCSPLLQGYASCQNIPCLCPTLSAVGPQCSSCLATINTGDANLVGSLMSVCGTATGTSPPVTTTATVTATPSSATTGLSTAAVSSPTISTSHSSAQGGNIAEMIAASYFNIVIVSSILFGFFSLFF